VSIDLSIVELSPPRLQFGGASTHADPKVGLLAAGPFDLRFGSARKDYAHIGIISPADQIDAARRWLERCGREIPALGDASFLKKPFPGFTEAFHKKLVIPDASVIVLDDDPDAIVEALRGDPFECFQRVVDLYASAHARLASRDINRPDIVLVCIPDRVLTKVSAVERKATADEVQRAKALRRRHESEQPDLFDMLDEVEQTPEDFLKRDLRLALKARALKGRLPIVEAVERLCEEARIDAYATEKSHPT
jgi:hypothetical protein